MFECTKTLGRRFLKCSLCAKIKMCTAAGTLFVYIVLRNKGDLYTKRLKYCYIFCLQEIIIFNMTRGILFDVGLLKGNVV